VVVNADGSFSYNPRNVAIFQAMNVGDFMTDTFSYTIQDNYILPLTSTATISIEVEGLNDPPVAENDQYLVPRNGSQTFAVLVNDHDIDGTLDPSSVVVTSGPAHGNVTVLANGSLQYTPTTNYSGSDLLKYTVRDNSGAVSNEASVTIRVNGAPVAVNDQLQTFPNTQITISVLANDHDDDGTLVPSSVTIVDKPRNGTAQVNPNGTVLYRPKTSFVGTDSFTYTVRDNDGFVSNVATVSIGVIVDEFPWTNPRNNLDVNNDGSVSPIDALLVINDLNFNGPRILPNPPVPPFTPPPFLDTSRDNQASPIDALLVINFLNNRGGRSGEGEGEGSFTVTSGGRDSGSGILLAAPLISPDVAGQIDTRAEDPVTRVKSDQPAATDDFDWMIGSKRDARLAAMDQYLSSSAIEEALEEIAGDIGHSDGDELLEDLAMRELLFGKQE
jgi:VCBS repeat-containing protein